MRLIPANSFFNLRILSLYLIDGFPNSRSRTGIRGLHERMEGKKSPDHLQVTAGQTRQDFIADATIVNKKQASETVKTICLKINNPEFSFKAGQWVDLFIPGVDEVSGFSMCSSPRQLRIHKTVHLAIKFSKHPPAYWMHTHSRIGSVIKLRSGGNFYYDLNSADPRQNLLLIAGGVGINPLASILQYVADQYKHPSKSPLLEKPDKVVLLFSAKTNSELLFRDLLISLDNDIPSVECKFFTTKEKLKRGLPGSSSRIQDSHLQEVIKNIGQNPNVYICGPSSMIGDMERSLLKLGVNSDNIHYEKWW